MRNPTLCFHTPTLTEILTNEDKDSVDAMTTFEFYLEKNGSVGEALRTIPGKPEVHPPQQGACLCEDCL